MHTLTHGVINFVIAYVLGFTPEQIVIIVLAGTIIDVDHLLYYAWKKPHLLKRPLQFYNMTVKHWRWYEAKLFLFHTLEFNLVILLLGFVNPLFFYISLGIGIHLIGDVYDYLLHLRSWVWLKHWFLTYYLVWYVKKKRKLKKRSKKS